jgi:hypothetical protein
MATVAASACAGMVGIVTDVRPESRILQIDNKNYPLAKALTIEREGRGHGRIELTRQLIGQGVFFELEGNAIRVIRLLDKPVLN